MTFSTIDFANDVLDVLSVEWPEDQIAATAKAYLQESLGLVAAFYVYPSGRGRRSYALHVELEEFSRLSALRYSELAPLTVFYCKDRFSADYARLDLEQARSGDRSGHSYVMSTISLAARRAYGTKP